MDTWEIAFWLCWVCAAIANSFMDWFGFDNKSDDWTHKYASPIVPAPNNLYYKLAGIPFKEKFLFSSNLLCWTTDRFHFWQFIQTSLVVASICLAIHIFDLVSLLLPLDFAMVWGFVTHFSYIFVRKHYTKEK